MAKKRFHGSFALKYGAKGALKWTATAALSSNEANEAICQTMPFHAPKSVVANKTANMTMS